MTNYFSFIPYPYKLGLIRTLVDRAYKINNTWLGFYEDVKKLTEILKKNLFPAHLVERVVDRYLTLTVMSAIPRSPFQTQLLTFILNHLKLALFLLSRKKGFADLLSVIVTTAI